MPAVRADSSGRRNTSIMEVLMGRPAGWMKELTGRSPMKSPGAPSLRRDVERAFWGRIGEGLSSEEAALAVGASPAAGISMVPGAWRHGDVHARRGLVPVLVLRGTRGDRDAAGARRRGARDRPPARSFAVDDLARAEAQRGHSWRQARVPRVRRAVEGGADGSPAEDREARRRRGTARGRAAT